MNNIKETDPRIEQPKNLKIKLKEHQKSSVYAMLHLENKGELEINLNSVVLPRGGISLKKNSLNKEENIFGNDYWYNSYWTENNNNNTYKNINYILNTNFGILSDKVGAGKTLSVVTMITLSLIPPNNPKILNSTQFTSLKYIDSEEPIKTNLILIPHNLASQWYKTFTDNTRLKIKLIHRHNILNNFKSVYNIFDNIDTETDTDILPEQCIEFYDVIIVTSTMAQDFFSIYRNVKWSRIIIDEVLSIRLPSEIPWKANFIWFITATPSGLEYIKRNYIRDIFCNLQKIVFNYLVIKNNDDYISQSMNLPTLNQILIRCLTPRVLNIIKDYVTEDVINMLNAGNITEAISKINCNADTDDNIFKAITDKLIKDIHNKKAELKYQSERIVDDEETQKETIKKLSEKINSLETKLKSIEEKIKSYANEACPICLVDFQNPAVMKCCNNLFCIPCLTMINGKCPMCREPFELKDLNVIIKKEDKKGKKHAKEKEKELLNKQENLINIINKKPTGKFLIFSSYENTNDSIAILLKKNKINFTKLSGSCSSINNMIDKFDKGEIKVLLLNSQYYGSGLNLQMASDIIIYHQMNKELETQIIGRAQRIGRSEPLNVYYLLHDNEQHNVTNPSLDISIYDTDDTQLLNFINNNNFENNIINQIENNPEFWDSEDEEAFKKAELKKQKEEQKKTKKVVQKRTRKTVINREI
jgi:hypothetical protein